MLLAMALIGNGAYASTADQELLDILLKNGSINKTQYKSMLGKEGLASSQLLEILSQNGTITKDQYSSLTTQNPALAAAPPVLVTPQHAGAPGSAAQSGGEIKHIEAGVTEGGAPEPARVGKEIMPGITVTGGGFIEAATIYRTNNESADVGSNFNSNAANTTGIVFPNNVNGHQSEFRESARQSRVSLLVQGDVDKYTKLSSYVETDFLGVGTASNSTESNSYTPRLRLGYMTFDQTDWGFHFLAGQNWSLLTTNKVGINPRAENIPLTVDAQYVPGFNWTRNAGLRVVGDFADHSVWAGLSVESPQVNYGQVNGNPTLPALAGGVTAVNAAGISATNSTSNNVGGSLLNNTISYSTDPGPDVIQKLAFDPGFGHYEIFGIERFFHNNVTANYTNHTFVGGGGGAAALLPVVPKFLDVQLNFMGGKGIGRYGSAQLPDVAFASNGAMVPLTQWTGLLGIVAHPDPALDIYTYLGGEFVNRFDQTIALRGGTAAAQATAANALSQVYGYGDNAMNNSGCINQVPGSACTAQTSSVWQVSPGFWYNFYKGDVGTFKAGLQYSYTRRNAFSGVNNVTPHADENIVMLSFRYYPFQK